MTTINTNIQSMNAQRNLSASQNSLSTSIYWVGVCTWVRNRGVVLLIGKGLIIKHF